MGGDVVGLVAVILLFGGGTLALLSISPIGKALAAKMLGRTTLPPDDETVPEELKALRQEVEELRHSAEHVAELGERVDLPGAAGGAATRGSTPPAGEVTHAK